MPNPDLISSIAAALKTDESFVEKDWHVVRALGVIDSVKMAGIRPIFSGGTSLAKAWGLINRFSEDIDFKVDVTAENPSAGRTLIRNYRAGIVEAMTSAGFPLNGEPLVGNKGLFFRASFNYGATFPIKQGLRPGLLIEMTFAAPALPSSPRSVQSFLALAQKQAPEISAFPCVDPIETAADKLSALAWRTYTRDRQSQDDDATIVRHLHDLAALAGTAGNDSRFTRLVQQILDVDSKRAKNANFDGEALLRAMLPKISSDPVWRAEYEGFVERLSYAAQDKLISFDVAMAMCRELVKGVLGAT